MLLSCFKKHFSHKSTRERTLLSVIYYRQRRKSLSSVVRLRRTKEEGFTLIEILIVVTIIGIISVFLLANYRTKQKINKLRFAAEEIVTITREAQNLSMSIEKTPTESFGYGAYISNAGGISKAFIFSDLDNNKCFDSGDGRIRDYYFPSGIDITSIKITTTDGTVFEKGNGIVSIFFVPPFASTSYIDGSADNQKVSIQLKIDDPLLGDRVKQITFYRVSGKIEIE